MVYFFTLQGRLPGLNEIVNASRRNRFVGAKQKKVVTERCAYDMYCMKVPKFLNPVVINFKWIEPNAKRDRDNVQSGAKFILDAMQIVGVIKNDSRKHVKDVKHDTSEIDKLNPRIEITISDEI